MRDSPLFFSHDEERAALRFQLVTISPFSLCTAGLKMPRDGNHNYKNPSRQRSILSTGSFIVLALLIFAALCQLVFILISVHPPFDDITTLEIVT
jgi:hypothetical protein